MRVTQNTLMRQFLSALRDQNNSIGNSIRQLGDGKRVRVTSDDPSGARRAIGLRGRLVRTEGFGRSSAAARADLQTIDSRLGEIFNRLTEARALALEAASGVFQGGNDATASRIESIREELISLGNTFQNGRYLFGGTQNLAPPFDATGAYNGNNEEASAPLDDGLSENVTVDGSRVFQDAVDALATLEAAAAAVRADDQTAVGNLIPDLKAAIDTVILLRGEIGTRLERIEDNLVRLDEEQLQLQTRIAEIEDVDVAQVAVEFSGAISAQNAISQVATSVLGRSLFDYLG